jgi:hypothetical protein
MKTITPTKHYASTLHLRLNLQTFLPSFAIIEEASHHDNARSLQLCAGLQAGEITVFDKAYVHFANLFNLTGRSIFWVTRAKDNLRCRVCRKRLRNPEGNIIRDDEITLVTPESRSDYPQHLRRVVAWDRFGLFDLADFYGTASGHLRHF